MTKEKAAASPLISVDMKAWRLKDYRRFMKATEDNDFEGMFTCLAVVVKAWPYEGNPSDPAAFDELTLEQWRAVTEAVGAAMSNQFSQGN